MNMYDRGERLTKDQMKRISELHHVPATTGNSSASSVLSHITKLSNNTWRAHYLNGTQVVFYHHTAIITLKPNGECCVDMGGWQTSTTRERLNAYMPHGWHCYQRRGNLYLGRLTYTDTWGRVYMYAVPASYSWTINADGSLNTYELEAWPHRLKPGQRLLDRVMIEPESRAEKLAHEIDAVIPRHGEA